MHTVCANAKLPTGIAGAMTIPAIRISGHNVRAGKAA